MDTAARCRSCLFGERGWNADADGDEGGALGTVDGLVDPVMVILLDEVNCALLSLESQSLPAQMKPY